MKRPAFQFYPKDWLTDLPLRACSIGARGLWAELLCLMHSGDPYGHLATNGAPLDDAAAARLVGVPIGDYRRLLRELEAAGVPSRTEAGILFSRRMVRDEELRRIKAAAGQLGGRATQAKGGAPARRAATAGASDSAQAKVQANERQTVAAAAAVAVGAGEVLLEKGSGEKPPPPPAGFDDDPEPAALARFPIEYQGDVQTALGASLNPYALARELHALLDGMPGHGAPMAPAILGAAVRDLLLAGGSITGLRLRAFARPEGPASRSRRRAPEPERPAPPAWFTPLPELG